MILGNQSNVHEGWNYIEVTASSTTVANTWYTHLRYRPIGNANGDVTHCALAEIDFLGKYS